MARISASRAKLGHRVGRFLVLGRDLYATTVIIISSTHSTPRANDYFPVMEEFRFSVQHPPEPEPFNSFTHMDDGWWHLGAEGGITLISLSAKLCQRGDFGGGAFILCFCTERSANLVASHTLTSVQNSSGGHSLTHKHTE